MTRNGDDSVSLQANYSKEEGPPLARALMRVEAELLIEDARRLRTPDDVCRTAEHRSADALVLLLLRTAAALGHPVEAGHLKRFKSGSHLRTP